MATRESLGLKYVLLKNYPVRSARLADMEHIWRIRPVRGALREATLKKMDPVNARHVKQDIPRLTGLM
jgi:hypothetical protein